MWDIVWVSPQGHRSVSESRHFLLQALQCPCSVRKRFCRDRCCQGRSKPGCWIVGSHTRWELTTWADFQLCLHQLLMSTGCKSSHNGFLDVSRSNGGLRISGWIGQLSCLMIFSTSLSVAAFLHRAGGSMLESTYLGGGLSRLHSAGEDTVLWLTSYGSWHAYEKKKKKMKISTPWRITILNSKL